MSDPEPVTGRPVLQGDWRVGVWSARCPNRERASLAQQPGTGSRGAKTSRETSSPALATYERAAVGTLRLSVVEEWQESPYKASGHRGNQTQADDPWPLARKHPSKSRTVPTSTATHVSHAVVKSVDGMLVNRVL